ncbi:MAG: hypothetical protein NT087_04035 [Deltaproteobacteria bacterium]|nr:hypothetical protein [Deltaproteobacteria bacterium]
MAPIFPKVFMMMNGEFQLQEENTGRIPNNKDAEFCVKYVVDLATKTQERLG